ncbi:MAG: S8 family serine peptidase [Flavobacteriales bacterium]|jgi:subtilisin family serine protease|nr:S8 family serine peptidase [Flavobacteriales bacterium]
MRLFASFTFLVLAVSLQASMNNRIMIRLASNAQLKAVPIAARAVIGAEPVDRLSAMLGALRADRLTPTKPGMPALFVVELPEGIEVDQALAAYRLLPGVLRAERDHMGHGGGDRDFTPNDPHYAKQWGLHNDGSFALSPAVAGADIDMQAAWEIEQGSEEVTVAIIDSGVRLQHPDWGDRIWQNVDEIAGNGIDDDSNGFIDDAQGWDFANNDNDPTDDQGHGTNVTSIVAAVGDNGVGFTGVDLNCKAMVIKALNSSNQGFYSWWVAGMYYAIDNGADVISMSMGGTDPSPEMQAAVDYALSNDVLVVACMMNTNSSTPFIPAALNGVLAVGATKPNDRRAVPFYWSASSGSNYGSHISVCAPGDYIYGLSHASNVSFTTYWSGTSQATPHVSALAALLKAQQSTRTPAQIRAIIEATAEDQVGDPLEDTPGFDIYHGHGRINAFNALLFAVGSGELGQTEGSLTVFPNPAAGPVSIRATASGQLVILDGSGRIVREQRLSQGGGSVLSSLAPGAYLARFTSQGNTLSQRFIVQ